MTDNKDEQLWRVAQRRAQFKKSVFSYIIINIFLWIIWWFTTGKITGFTGFPWPVWVMIGWGLGLAKQYYEAYATSGKDLAEIEYEKLKRKQQ